MISNSICCTGTRDPLFRGHWFRYIFYAAGTGFLLMALGACTTIGHVLNVSRAKKQDSYHVIENVPFFAQDEYQCGPSALAGVIRFYGKNVTPGQIAREIFKKEVRGTLTIDMIYYAEKQGFNAQWYSGSLEDLRENIDRGHPLIAMVDPGIGPIRKPHYLVVVGYGADAVIVNNGIRQYHPVSGKRFLRQWERTQMWTLHIVPKDPT